MISKEREWKGKFSFVKEMSGKKGWKGEDQNDEKHDLEKICGWKYQKKIEVVASNFIKKT